VNEGYLTLMDRETTIEGAKERVAQHRNMLRGRVSIISSGIMVSRLVPHLVSYRRPGTAYE